MEGGRAVAKEAMRRVAAVKRLLVVGYMVGIRGWKVIDLFLKDLTIGGIVGLKIWKECGNSVVLYTKLFEGKLHVPTVSLIRDAMTVVEICHMLNMAIVKMIRALNLSSAFLASFDAGFLKDIRDGSCMIAI